MAIDKDWLLVLTGSEIGQGEMDLGAKLTELFFKVLPASDALPARILFLNTAIFLTTEGSPILDELRALEEAGTEIVSCITCLTYFDRMERVAVGERGDMKNTVASIGAFRKVVTI
jgi:hypothetical protein